MTTAGQDIEAQPSRVKRLKAATHAAHERLDQFIMAAQPFAGRENFGRFVRTQYRFHRDLDALFFDGLIDELLPDLQGRRRLALIEQDLADLGLTVPEIAAAPVFTAGDQADLAEALGWLYVVEGSNLGAAFLLKDATKLGLSEGFGARHLAGAPEGRGLHWRTFTVALDAIELSDSDEAKVIAGAEAAFATVEAYAREEMA